MKISELFTISFPSWKNLRYLQLFYRSLRENSHDKEIELVLHINECLDTKKWADDNNIRYTFSETNLGISVPMNQAQSLVKTEWTVLLSDDIYMLPQWDLYLFKVLEYYKFADNLWVAPRLIEPYNAFAPQEHPYCTIENYGTTLAEFREDDLLRDYKKFFTTTKKLPNGNMCIKSQVFRNLGGYDTDYATAADSQLTWNFYKKYGSEGIKQCGSSLAYHFGSVVSNTNQQKKLEANRQAIKLFQKKNGFFIGDITKIIQNN